MFKMFGLVALLLWLAVGSETWAQSGEAAHLTASNPWSLNCEKPRDAAEVGACEQKRATDVAQRAYDLSVVQAVIGIVGLLAVVVSLALTLVSARAAVKSSHAAVLSAEAALDGVKVQQEIGQATVQAYLAPASADFNVGEHAFHANVVIENSGQSPAKRVRVAWALRVRLKWNGGSLMALESNESFVAAERASTGYISPKENRSITLHATSNDLKPELVGLLRDATYYVCLECRVHWRDVFERAHYVTFELAEFPTAITGLGGAGGNRAGELHVRQAPTTSLLGDPKKARD